MLFITRTLPRLKKSAKRAKMKRIMSAKSIEENGALIFSLSCHLAVYLVVFTAGADLSPRFTDEFAFLLALSAMLSLASFLVPTVVIFRIINLCKLLISLVLFQILLNGVVLVEILLLVPFAIESGLYDETKFAGANIVVCLVLAGFQIIMNQRSLTGPAGTAAHLIVLLLTVGGPTAMALLMINHREVLVQSSKLIESNNTTIKNLMDANKAFQVYAGNVGDKSAEKERNRITRELHDVVGYTLTNVIMMMNAGKLLQKRDPEQLDAIFDKIRIDAENALKDTRRTLYRLRDMQDSERKGLQVIFQIVKNFGNATGIDIDFNAGNLPWSLGPELDDILLRLVQESMTNSCHHGKADRIGITMWRTEKEIRVTVWDNGTGGSDEIKEGIGLSGMRERLALVGGHLRYKSDGAGFRLYSSIPFESGDGI